MLLAVMIKVLVWMVVMLMVVVLIGCGTDGFGVDGCDLAGCKTVRAAILFKWPMHFFSKKSYII